MIFFSVTFLIISILSVYTSFGFAFNVINAKKYKQRMYFIICSSFITAFIYAISSFIFNTDFFNLWLCIISIIITPLGLPILIGIAFSKSRRPPFPL